MKLLSNAKTAIAAIFAIGVVSTPVHASGNRTYEVTVTNITQGIIFTPILGATHTTAASFFSLGDPASHELAMLAEGGDTAPLQDVLGKSSAVGATETVDSALPAGQTATFQITGKRWQRTFSMAAMLLPTNDGFVALDSVSLPRRGSITYYAKGYDSGTELNDQNCHNIPGPQCGGSGEGFNSAGGEGFVHIHNGIHEQGNLPGGSAVYDWRNPVAEVTIRRIR